MRFFASDYGYGCYPEILKRLEAMEKESVSGYGVDPYTEKASKKILDACGLPDGGTFFVVGGTQCNQVVISYFLRPWEGVVSCTTGHINVHETGAIENAGHKVITVPGHDGKIDARELDDFLKESLADRNAMHVLLPGMVYISYPTEYGTLYSKEELTNIYQVTQKYNIPLYIDGARLFYGLESSASDLTLKELAHLCDVFYIGGTKEGALFGEGIVFPHGVPAHFPAFAKQHGALLAKGWLLGLQFDELFSNGLIEKGAKKADELAAKLSQGLIQKGWTPYLKSPTNLQFFIASQEKIDRLSRHAIFEVWEKEENGREVIRLATSWASTEEDVDDILRSL